MNKFICVTIGDIEGIGIHLLINLWKRKKINNFVLLTNFKLFNKFLIKNKIKIKTKIVNNLILKKNQGFLIYNINAKSNIENTYNSLTLSYELIKKNIFSGVINLPLNKEKIINKIDKKFIGQTEFYQKIGNNVNSNMIFYSKKIITSTITTHIPIKNINLQIHKKNFLYNRIKSLYGSLTNDFKIDKPKIILLGLNPHAGENGKIGKEEFFLKKVLDKLKKEKINIFGPLSADSIFSKENVDKYDCFLSIYHDQALIPFKIISNKYCLNFTGSLDIVRLSPVHGTANDLIRDSKVGDVNSLLFCFQMIYKIINNRLNIVKS